MAIPDASRSYPWAGPVGGVNVSSRVLSNDNSSVGDKLTGLVSAILILICTAMHWKAFARCCIPMTILAIRLMRPPHLHCCLRL